MTVYTDSCERCGERHAAGMDSAQLQEERDMVRQLYERERDYSRYLVHKLAAERAERDEALAALERCRAVGEATAEAGRAATEEARAWARYWRAAHAAESSARMEWPEAPAEDEPDWLVGE